MFPAILDDVTALLEERKMVLNFVDIGSRNGVIELRDIA